MAIEPMTSAEARERWQLLVSYDHLGQTLNRTSERRIFHYTGLAGLRGIASEGKLWASDYRALNDRSELSFGLDILEMCVAHDSFADITPELKRTLLIQIALMKRGSRDLYVFCVSFCMKANLLSQWRAYAPSEGVSIGFDRTHVQKKAEAAGFVTGSVSYFNAEGSNLKPWLTLRTKLLPEILERHRSDDLQPTFELDKWICETGAFIKHPAFAEEAECRCVRVVEGNELDAPEILTRMSGRNLVPYIELALCDGDRYFGQECIIVGPTANPDPTIHAVQHLVTRMGNRNGFSTRYPFHPLRV